MKVDTVSVLGGTGSQGFGLALRWVRAGKKVIIGSRVLSRAVETADRIKKLCGKDSVVQGMENAEAASETAIVVLTVPFEAQIATINSIAEALSEGQVVVDVTVPLETAIGGRPARLLGVWSGSAAEQAARHVPPGVEVASAFHNISASALEEIEKPVDCDVLVCADKKDIRDKVRPWVECIPDCRYVDGGKLENSRIVEAMTALLIGVNIRHKAHGAGIRVTGIFPETE